MPFPLVRGNLKRLSLLFVVLILFQPMAIFAQQHQPTDEFFEDLLEDYGFETGPESDEVEYFEPEVVRETAHDVIESPEFRSLPRLDLGEGVQARPQDPEIEISQSAAPSGGGGQIGGGFADFLRDLFGGAATALIALLALLVVGGILAAIVFVVQGWRREDSPAVPDDATDDEEPAPLVTPGARPPDAWLAAARAAAAAGRFEEAISLLLLGAMGHAERAGLIRPRRGLTYRDYLRVVPRASAWYAALDRLIRTYAPVGFGRRSASARMFEEVVGPYEAALAAEPVPSSMNEQIGPA